MLAELGESGRVAHENVKVQYFIDEIKCILIQTTPHCVVSGVYLGLHISQISKLIILVKGCGCYKFLFAVLGYLHI